MHMGKTPFSSITEAFFNNAVLLRHWFVQCCKNRQISPKPARMCGASGYISACFAIGSSDFFSFSDDTFSSLIYETWSPSRRRPAFAADQDLDSFDLPADSPLSSRSVLVVSQSPAAIRLMLERAVKEQILSQHCCKCRAITVACTGLPYTPLMFTVSVFHAWARWNSTHRDGISLLCGYESHLSALAESFLF